MAHAVQAPIALRSIVDGGARAQCAAVQRSGGLAADAHSSRITWRAGADATSPAFGGVHPIQDQVKAELRVGQEIILVLLA